jgi:hypothetical protein
VARKQAFTIRNIRSGWSGTGLYPFNPQKVLSRVPTLPSVEATPREPTPDPINPLENPELNSSPIETPTMQAANHHIEKHARSRSAEFNTPAWKHVLHMATALDRSLAKNWVQAAELSDLQRIVSTRKQQQPGKHKILHGETILATPAILQSIEVAETVTKSRQRKQTKPANPSDTPPPNIDPALFFDSLGSNSEEDNFDYIIVASA